MKKIFLLAASLGFASSALASDVKVDLDGMFHFQSGFRNQNKLERDEKNVSGERRDFAFYSDANVAATLSNTADELTYGGKVVLQTTTKSKATSSYNGSHLFVESNFGKVEAGSPFDAGSKMRVTGYDVAAGTADDYVRYVNFDGAKMKDSNGNAPQFMTSWNVSFLDTKFVDHVEPARKISYFTPKMNGLQAGISYIPDTSNNGQAGASAVTVGRTSMKAKTASGDEIIIEEDTNVKDAFSGGVSYEHNLSDETHLRVAATGEYGKPAKKTTFVPVNDNDLVQKKLSALKTYNIGAVVTHGSFSLGASYGSFNKSLTTKEYHKAGRNTNYYNAAVAYGQGPVTASLGYFKSNHFKNTFDAVTLGTDYKLAPGLVPYAEVTCFQAKGKPVQSLDATKKKTKGTIGLLGLKLKF